MNTQFDTSQVRHIESTPSRRTVYAMDSKHRSIVIFKLVVSLFVASITIVSPARGADPVGWESLDVLLYNTWLKPIGSQPRKFRASRIPEAIADYSAPESKAFRQLDVIVLNEAFDDYYRDSFLEAGLRRLGFAHQTEVAGHDQGIEQDSGVFIASRWPIFADEYLVYDEEICSGDDCLAEKGAVYAGIEKSGVRYHVFATHLQASGDEQDVRESQMSELNRFVRQQAIPSDEAVIIAGDLNLWRRNDHQFNSIARLLGAVQPRVVNDAKAAGYDPTAPYYTYDAPNNDNAPGDAKDYFDYVLFRREHRQPISELSFNATVPLRTDDCYTLTTVRLIHNGEDWVAREKYGDEQPPCSHDLSDHHATHGRFVFEVPTPRLNIVEPKSNAIVSYASTLPMRAVVDDAIQDHPDSTAHRPNRDGSYTIQWYATNAYGKRYSLPQVRPLGSSQSTEGEWHEALFDHSCQDYVTQVTAKANTRAGTISDSVAVKVSAQIVGALTINTIPQGGDFYIEVTGDTLDVPSFKVSSRLTKTCHPEPLDTQGVSWLVTSDDGPAQAVTGGEHIVVRNAMFARNERNVPQPLTVRAAFSLADEEVDDTVRLVPCAGRNQEVADDLALCPKEIDSACYSPWTDEECSYEMYETRRAIETARLLLLEELLSGRMADRLCPRCSTVEPIDTRVAPEMVGRLVERIQTQLIEGPVRVTAQLRELVAQLPQVQRIAVLRDVQRTIASRNPLYSMPRAESSR